MLERYLEAHASHAFRSSTYAVLERYRRHRVWSVCASITRSCFRVTPLPALPCPMPSVRRGPEARGGRGAPSCVCTDPSREVRRTDLHGCAVPLPGRSGSRGCSAAARSPLPGGRPSRVRPVGPVLRTRKGPQHAGLSLLRVMPLGASTLEPASHGRPGAAAANPRRVACPHASVSPCGESSRTSIGRGSCHGLRRPGRGGWLPFVRSRSYWRGESVVGPLNSPIWQFVLA